MKFRFIGNAGGIFYGDKGTKILCDPWIVDGVFEGSWFHYPPLKTKLNDIQKVDAIYVSHIHPDHFDHRNFNFNKKMPIIILDEGPNFLKKNLIKMGYENLIEIKNNETKVFKEFKLTVYKPFTKHIFEESLLGNLIDSALVLDDGICKAINFNDNTPDISSCKKLNKKFKKIDFAMLNYNAAGPYPSCFDNLSIKQKKVEHHRILKRNFNHLCKIIPILNPKTILPFAGSYILGGKYHYKNNYLGTTTLEDCAKYLKKKLNKKYGIICLRENDVYDISKKQSLNTYKKIKKSEMRKYIKKISSKKYDYELDPSPKINLLKKDILIARKKFEENVKKYKIKIKSNVFIKIKNENIKIYDGSDIKRKIYCEMDPKLIRRILDKKSHWNNAEIGAHINFFREPNIMEPDLHTSLSFFHL